MGRYNHTVLTIGIGLAAPAGFCAAPVVKAAKAAAGAVQLEWTGGAPDFEVFRFDRPDAIEDPSNLLITVPVSTHTDPTPPNDPVSFYSVRATGCDPDGIYVLDAPILLSCPWVFWPPSYLLDMQYIEVSQAGTQMAAGPVPGYIYWTTPVSCPGGAVEGHLDIDIYVECRQNIWFNATFTGPDTITGTFIGDPPIVGPPLQFCLPVCAPVGSFPFTARR